MVQHTRFICLLLNYTLKPHLKAHAEVSSRARGLQFVLSLHLLSYFVHARSEGSGMTMSTVKPVLSGHSKIDNTKILMTYGNA